MELEFEVKMSSGALYDYMIHHTYTSLSGILGTIVGLLLLVATLNGGSVLYLIAGAIVLLYQPWTLFLRSKQQMLNTEAFKNPLHYKMTEEGVEVSQNDSKEMQSWDNMYKAISTRQSIILYTSKINASIFPKAQLEDKYSVIEMIATHMPPAKVKIRG